MGDWVLRDGEWVHDPNAPTPITLSDYDPSATRVDLPAVTVTYAGHVDWVSPPSRTSGQQDHSDPWQYAGEDADPPQDTGRPADG